MTALIIIGCILGYALLSLTIIPLSAFVEVADCLTGNTNEYTNFKNELKYSCR